MRRATGAILMMFLFGCAAPEPESVASMVTDSAGITVVTHAEMQDVLELERSSGIRLGEGTEIAELFYQVRGGVLLPDERVAIANAGSQELLFLSSYGSLVGRFGGDGQGPEEFSNLFRLQGLPDGSVVASDPGNGRLVWVTSTGELAHSRSVSFEPEATPAPDQGIIGRGFVFGVTPAREVLAVPWARAEYSGAEGLLPLRGELRRYSSNLEAFEPIDSVRLRLWFEQSQAEGPPIGQILGAPLLVFSANGSWLAYSEGAAYRIVLLKDGVAKVVIHEQRPLAAFTPDSVPRHYHHAAEFLPAYSELVVDSDGRVWARLGTPESSDVAEWHVFSERGMRGAVLRLPSSTSVLDARGGQVLVLERDELDVESVVLLRLANGVF